MVRLEGGTFRMGSPDNEPGRKADEGPQHEVTIRGPFLISATEVTHAQFIKVMGTSPAQSALIAARPQNLPVEWVTWDEANDFCNKLTETEKNQPWTRKGWAYRLPTEAEWEYAARAGTEAPFASGDQIDFEKQAFFRRSDDAAACCRPIATRPRCRRSAHFPMEVGRTEPNKLRPVRHARQRRRVVPRLVQTGLPRGRTGQPDRPGRRRQAGDPRRLVSRRAQAKRVPLPALGVRPTERPRRSASASSMRRFPSETT